MLAFSEAKDQAVIDILDRESAAMGKNLRAVVVTDFERMTSGVKSLQNVLDPDAGSAVHVFHAIVSQPKLEALAAILVTGKTLMVAANHQNESLNWFNGYLQAQGLNAKCRFETTASPHAIEVLGEGPDWSSRAYVGMVTAALEAGMTRCLVGTRGIFGEGWDSLSLNTLIDLTSVTTSTSVQQLRGRSIRKDPGWTHKLAHNWDVICVAPQFEKGDSDLRRLIQRHGRYWGVVPMTASRQLIQDATALLQVPSTVPQAARGQIVKGLMHLDPDLPYELVTRGPRRARYARYTQRSMDAISQTRTILSIVGHWRGIQQLLLLGYTHRHCRPKNPHRLHDQRHAQGDAAQIRCQRLGHAGNGLLFQSVFQYRPG